MLRSVLLVALTSLLALVLPSATTAQTIAPNGTMRLNFVQYGPFQVRQEAGSAVWNKPLTFQSMRTGSQQTWQPPFIVMYGGERLNDVWITSDSGSTWEIVSGRAVNYTSAVPENGLNDQSRTADCYDNDNLYLVGGTTQGQTHSSNVSRSTDVIHWVQYDNQAFYGRQRSTCAVNKAGTVFVFGGLTRGSQRSLPNASTDTNDHLEQQQPRHSVDQAHRVQPLVPPTGSQQRVCHHTHARQPRSAVRDERLPGRA